MNSDSFEEQVNALIDGELSPDAQAELERASQADAELAASLREAKSLQSLLGGMPQHKAPRNLQRRLRAVPDAGGLEPAWFEWPRLGVLSGVVLLVLAVNLVMLYGPDMPWSSGSSSPGTGSYIAGQTVPTAQEIEQGRRDLELALTYLARASGAATTALDNQIEASLINPLKDHTVARINRTPIIMEAYQL